ncbi:hypothetical protein A9404_08425 [Halothiobacillus diazotrophicus]|uniref:Uncharacterized protein n=1 Tax=Halothiobacillus diazotrophicus TaxID=1860122 RepID=A0A191ZHN1_9GAMM|nr:hypothetical protein A9404_08425 [Halothiobacillus diazotrophicus]
MAALVTSSAKQVCHAGQQSDPAQVLGQSAIADLGITKPDLGINGVYLRILQGKGVSDRLN